MPAALQEHLPDCLAVQEAMVELSALRFLLLANQLKTRSTLTKKAQFGSAHRSFSGIDQQG